VEFQPPGELVTVLAAHRWNSNAELLADVARLGYLDGRVLDATYGEGTFWNVYRPDDFTAFDLDPEKSPIGYGLDFTDQSAFPNDWWINGFDTVVFDAPYKLNGTPDGAIDGRYGVHEVRTAQQRIDLMILGIRRLSALVKHRGYMLVKCQDQVCSGRMWWQTDIMTIVAEYCGLNKVDRFDLIGHHRPQPMKGRRQKHAHGRPSTLLVFQNTKLPVVEVDEAQITIYDALEDR